MNLKFSKIFLIFVALFFVFYYNYAHSGSADSYTLSNDLSKITDSNGQVFTKMRGLGTGINEEGELITVSGQTPVTIYKGNWDSGGVPWNNGGEYIKFTYNELAKEGNWCVATYVNRSLALNCKAITIKLPEIEKPPEETVKVCTEKFTEFKKEGNKVTGKIDGKSASWTKASTIGDFIIYSTEKVGGSQYSLRIAVADQNAFYVSKLKNGDVSCLANLSFSEGGSYTGNSYTFNKMSSFKSMFCVNKTCNSYNKWIKGVSNWALAILIPLSVLVISIAGVVWMTSSGNAERIALAKKLIFGVLSGLAILMLSRLILSTILGVI